MLRPLCTVPRILRAWFELTKYAVRKTIRQSTLTFDELVTVLTEVESTLNNCPLTYLYRDGEGPSYTVTPADVIYGHRMASTSTNQHYEVVSTAKSLTRRAKYQCHVLNSFIKQWKRLSCKFAGGKIHS